MAKNILPILALIAIEPDTGGATICAAISLVLILANSKNWRASIGILGVAISIIALTVMVIHAINPFKEVKLSICISVLKVILIHLHMQLQVVNS